MDRREFVARTAAELAALAAAGCGSPSRATPIVFPPPAPAPPPSGRTERFDIAVIGAGAFGGWTALHLRQRGASVVLIDQFGPGNSRATSGDETRGVRTSYGDRGHGRLWMRWARQATDRWTQFDEEHRDHIGGQLFFTTGDIICREEEELYTRRTLEWWSGERIAHEVVPVDEARNRWPVVDFTGITVVLYEPHAGVVRARRACEGFDRAGLIEHEVVHLLRRDAHHAPAEALQVGQRRMGSHRDAVVHRETHGAADGGGIPGVITAGDVGR